MDKKYNMPIRLQCKFHKFHDILSLFWQNSSYFSSLSYVYLSQFSLELLDRPLAYVNVAYFRLTRTLMHGQLPAAMNHELHELHGLHEPSSSHRRIACATTQLNSKEFIICS